MITLKTIDAHAAGEPLRLIVSGFPSPHGKTMLAKREWVRTHADHLRRALMLEPRGHADMYGAILTEPVSPGSHAGVLFMHNEGYSTMCGHGVIAVTTMALERGLLMPGGTARQSCTTRRPERSARRRSSMDHVSRACRS
jgi:Proline racemase